MNSSTIASVLMRSWMNVTRSLSASSSRTTDACAMPTDASSSSGLTISGKRRSLGRCVLAPRGQTMKCGIRIPWYANTFLVSALSRASISPSDDAPVYGRPSMSSTAATE